MKNIISYKQHLNEAVEVRNWRNKVIIDIPDESLEGMDLRSYDLNNANFWKINLRGCNMSGMDLKRCYFSGADLTGADLNGSDISDSSALSEAIFSDVKLNDSTVHKVSEIKTSSFNNSSFEGASIKQTKIYGEKESMVNFKGVKLDEVKFFGTFEGYNFSGSSFSNCGIHSEYNFNNCDLRNTEFDEKTFFFIFNTTLYNPFTYKRTSSIKGSNLEGSNISKFLEEFLDRTQDVEKFITFVMDCTGLSRKLQRKLGMAGMFSKKRD